MRLRFAVSVIVSIFSASALAGEARYPIGNLVSPNGEIVLRGGKSVRLVNKVATGGHVEFVDLVPGANWAHPARIEVTGASKMLVESIPVRVPPRDLKFKTDPVTFHMSDFGGKYKVAAPEHFFALMINGAADERHRNDFAFLYRTLVQVYGYLPKNIFVADSNFISTADSDLDGDGKPDIGYQSTMGGVQDLMKDLATKITANDQLLVATDDHGDTQDGESTLYLFDGEMKASAFATLLTAIPAGRVLSIHEPCYSGGFVRATSAPTRATMAAASDRELSWASEDLNWDEFIYRVISAFSHQTHDGQPVDADLNGDGKISAREAFGWAVSRDVRPESPLAEDGANSGFLATIGIGF
jgi:hypothetical protein